MFSPEMMKFLINYKKKKMLNKKYKNQDIKKIIPNVDSTLSIEDQVKESLKLLLK